MALHRRARRRDAGDADGPPKFDRLAARIGATTRGRKERTAQAIRDRGGARARVPRPHAGDAGPVGGRAASTPSISSRTRMLATETGIAENWSSPLAPVKPPFVWNAPQGSWTQWRGTQQDPIGRNHGETMGVYLPMDFRSKTPAEGLFETSAQLLNLQKIEHLLDRLAPPKWPEDVLGKIDRAEGRGRQGAVRDQLRELPQRLSLHLDRAEQVRQALHRGRARAAGLRGHRSGAVRRHRRPTPSRGTRALLPPPYKDQPIVPHAALRTCSRAGRCARRVEPLKLSDAETARHQRLSRASAARRHRKVVQGGAARRRMGHAARSCTTARCPISTKC